MSRFVTLGFPGANADKAFLRYEMGALQFSLKVPAANIISTTDLITGSWQHVAATYDGSVMRLYLNGQELSEAQLADRIEKNLGDAPAGQRKVLLKAHQDCTAAKFEPVIEAISQAGGELVHILEDKKKK